MRLGQGSPPRWHLARWPVLLVCLLGSVFTSAQQTARADDVEMQLRVVWGGGGAQRWKGQIRVSDGTISDLRLLGLEADQSACIYRVVNQIYIDQRTPRSYDGTDFIVRGNADTRISVELSSADKPAKSHKVEISLLDLTTNFHNSELDEHQNRLLIRRVPGDHLRVKLDRRSLVRKTGEAISFEVIPNRLGLPAGTKLDCEIELRRARQDDVLWSGEYPLTLDQDGSSEAIGPVKIDLPIEEGAYDIVLRTTQSRFVGAKTLHQRKIQLIALDDRAPFPERGSWQEVESLDPTEGGWRDWLKKIPALPGLPDYFGKPLSNERSEVQVVDGQRVVQLKSEGWQAYPLPIESPGKPHVLEVEYPTTQPQGLGISIIEPNAAGQVVPITLDSGVFVPDDASAKRSGRHRLIFWPRTEAPVVLLTNQHPTLPAQFGRLRVYVADELPDLDATFSRNRMVAAYMHKPLFPENFSASEAVDEWTERSLDDWVTFYEGATRFVKYLKHSGYNSAVVCVACEGSTIYPSQLIPPTPKYDTGIYFTTGQDPIRKDVLEMLMRLFDREGLTLIPAVEISHPLPELESQRRRGGSETIGLELFNDRRRRWQPNRRDPRIGTPPYNPLDRRVQLAVQNVVQEIVDRYSQHKAFGGVALQMGGDAIGLLPGAAWGNDNRTRGEFELWLRQQQGAGNESPNLNRQWLDWKCQRLQQFHQALHGLVTKHNRSAKLLLCFEQAFETADADSTLRPKLPDRDELMNAVYGWGIDPRLYRDQQGIVLLRPRRLTAPFEVAKHAVNLHLDGNQLDSVFKENGLRGAAFFREHRMQSLPSFNERSPFGKNNTFVTLLTHAVSTEQFQRRHFALSMAELDSNILVDGGWMLPLGQVSEVAPMLRTVQRLPNQPFTPVPPGRNTTASKAVTVRVLNQRNESFIYMVNKTPYPLSTSVEMGAPGNVRLEALGPSPVTGADYGGGLIIWTVTLPPYGLVAAKTNTGELKVQSWRVVADDTVLQKLTDQLSEVRARMNALRAPSPLPDLLNADFEQSPDQLPGWIHANGSGIVVKPDRKHSFKGRQSMRISSSGPVAWVRSLPIATPQTGRVTVLVRLRTSNPQQQPPLRLAIEAKLYGETYYRFAPVGQGNQVPRVDGDWGQKPILAHIDDLPSKGLSEFRIGFDLMGGGEVWIDDVQVFDKYFQPDERRALAMDLDLSRAQLEKGQVGYVVNYLDSYWPRFLRDQIPLPAARVATRLQQEPLPAEREADQDKSMLDRLKWPKLPFE